MSFLASASAWMRIPFAAFSFACGGVQNAPKQSLVSFRDIPLCLATCWKAPKDLQAILSYETSKYAVFGVAVVSIPEQPAADQRAQSVRELLKRSIALKEKLMADHCERVVAMADICVDSLCKGGKLLLCGNGGSAADAQHLAAEMLVRLRPDVNRDGLPAIALTLDPSSMTACGNDYAFR